MFFAHRVAEESSVPYTCLNQRHVIVARELAKPGKPSINNSRLIAQYCFTDKWYLKCIELHLTLHLSQCIDPRVGGACRGSRVVNSVAYVNTALAHAHLWQFALVTAQVDFARMFASVEYAQLSNTLMYFGVPVEWRSVILAQVAYNAFSITTIRVDLYKGLVEGSPISVLLVGLLLTHFLILLRASPTYKLYQVVLPGDDFQPPLELREIGWIDDWILHADSIDSMMGLLTCGRRHLALSDGV